MIEGVLVAIEPVLRDFHVQVRDIERHSLASRLNQVAHSLIGRLIVVDHHTACIDGRANAVVEHQRDAAAHELGEVVVLLGVLSLRDDDATHLVLLERLANLHLPLIALAALRHHDAVAALLGLLLNATQD